MAGIARGGLRPHHPTKHSFIIVGLILVLAVVGINYWSISTKNTRLLAEFATLQKNYKVMRLHYYEKNFANARANGQNPLDQFPHII